MYEKLSYLLPPHDCCCFLCWLVPFACGPRAIWESEVVKVRYSSIPVVMKMLEAAAPYKSWAIKMEILGRVPCYENLSLMMV